MILTRAGFGEPLAADGFGREGAMRVGTAAEMREETGAGEEHEGYGPEDTHRIEAPESKTGSISSDAS